METAFWLAAPAAVMWFGLWLAPWRPWSTREQIEPTGFGHGGHGDMNAVTVLIPARNEAEVIQRTLDGLQAQSEGMATGLKIIVIDDQSDDGTGDIARRYPNVEVISGQPLPKGWAGKLWALEQGKGRVTTPMTLLLDADIALEPGLLPALLAHKRATGAHFVSLMADLRRTSFWDRLLLPAFVYYFKLIYPFAVSNSPSKWVAAAAGGCVLVDTAALHKVNAFECLKGALIDDCTLARRIKDGGHKTWIGLSRGVISLRPYGMLKSVHDMVARSAFTQLRYSTPLLLVVTALFALAYWLPIAALLQGSWLAAAALLAMCAAYVPTLRYYGLSPVWSLASPLIGALYLGMTWSSAIRTWRGVRSQWKNRTYEVES